jgi:predicted ferric reductase
MWILEIVAEVILTFFDVPWSRRQWYAQVLCLTVFIAACFLAWYFLLG